MERLQASDRAAKDLLSPVWPHSTDIVVDCAYGATIRGRDGKEYLDFTSGIGVTNTGHCHPRVVRAIQRQAERLLHGQVTIVYHEPVLELVQELHSLLPPALDCYFFASSGSEAVESALKLARHATGRTNIIAFQGGYHGRSVGAMAVTTCKTIYRDHYQPLMPGVVVAPFPYAYRYGVSEDMACEWCIRELKNLLSTQTAPGETAAMLLEPILGEGGYVVPPAGFLRKIRELCDEHGILMILDEVQSGFGRTGRWFAFNHFGVVPDVLVMAKGLASGLPLSGIAAPKDLMKSWLRGSHGGTYGPNAVCAAAAVETIRTIRDENLVHRSATNGAYLISRLRELQKESDLIGDVRGLGSMIGCEFTASDGEPDRATARAIQEACLDGGLILITCGTYDHVIRWVPPLVASREEIDKALEIFRNSVIAVNESRRTQQEKTVGSAA